MASAAVRAVMMLSILLAFPAGVVGQDATTEADTSDTGALLDVRVISSECLQNTSCVPTQPSHLIEYFSADWCEPCLQVSSQLANQSGSHVMLQHHASPADETFLSDSKLRFDQTFRLVFIPSLVLDGTQLLTGTRQALDLPSVLENNSPEWSGLESLNYSEGQLTWSPNPDAHLRVWVAQPTPHTQADTIHTNLARAAVFTNASYGQLNLSNLSVEDGMFLVVMLERAGTHALNAASLAPTGLIDIGLGNDEAGSQSEPTLRADHLVLVVTAFLLLMLLPAIAMHRTLMQPSRTLAQANKMEEE
jgi:hypothetical protein